MSKEKTLLVGGSGMIGSHFADMYSGELDLLSPSHVELDITDRESIRRYFDKHPDITHLMNVAAYTNLTEAQKQRGDQTSPCWQINVVGVENLIDEIVGKDIFMIQVSTDYVFPGDDQDPGPYEESHEICRQPDRLSYYGHTKAVAEQLVRDALASRMAIFRMISPVVKDFDKKTDYLRFPLAYYEKHGELYPIFTDQQINITDVDEFCVAIKAIIAQKAAGIFHAGSSDITSPFHIMIHLFDLVYGRHDMVKPGSVIEYLKTLDDPTRYHIFGGLLNKETEKQLGVRFSSSQAIVERLYGPGSS